MSRLLLALGVFCAIAAAQSGPTIKKAIIPPTNASSGEEMFVTYCAACHGKDARGGGPAAAALKTPPANLTQLAAKNNGKYPEVKVLASLSGGTVIAHGTTDMPVWCDLLRSYDGGNRSVIQLRLSNLTKYIGSLQAK